MTVHFLEYKNYLCSRTKIICVVVQELKRQNRLYKVRNVPYNIFAGSVLHLSVKKVIQRLKKLIYFNGLKKVSFIEF
jgi:hypothetical protein